MITIKNLHFKWTVSRGQDTYGYNICALLVDGVKSGKTCGGGYDMKGTAFGQWLNKSYQTELQTFFAKEIEAFAKGTEDYGYADRQKFYGAMLVKETEGIRVVLDGACGFDCMRSIAKSALGLTLQWNKESDRYKNHSFYTAIIN